jgi:hypothetical protein
MQLSITPSELRKGLKEVRKRRKKYNCPDKVEKILVSMTPLFVEVNDFSDAKLTKRGVILFDEVYRMLVLYHKCVLADYEFEKYIPQSRQAFLSELNREMAEKYKTTFGFHAIVERDNATWFSEIQKDGFLSYGQKNRKAKEAND